MPVKMVAVRRHYEKAHGMEFLKGQTFDVPDDKEAERLVRLRRAQRYQTATTKPDDDVDALRSRYRTTTGRDPDRRWGLARLQKETTGTYGRRDMRAED